MTDRGERVAWIARPELNDRFALEASPGMADRRPLRRSCCLLLLLTLVTHAGCGRVDPGAGPKGAEPVNGNLPFEPLPNHPRAELSNLRFSRGRTGREIYQVDWRWTQKGPDEMTMTLVIKPSNRPEMLVTVDSVGKKSGTISGEILSNRPGEEGGPILERGCEMYLVIGPGSRYKLSNSVTSGDASVTPTRPAPR